MSYIESHQELEHHFKVLDLMGELRIDIDTALGRLHRFWWWCVDYAETGYLTKHPAARIDAKFGRGFVEAMMKAKFIDKEQYRLHDWPDYAGRYLLTRYRTRKPLYVASIFVAYGRKHEAEQLLAQAVKLARITQAQADAALSGLRPEDSETPDENAAAHAKIDEFRGKSVDSGVQPRPKQGGDPTLNVKKIGQGTPEKSGKGPQKIRATQLNPTQLSATQPIPPQQSVLNASEEKPADQPPTSSPAGLSAWIATYPRKSALKDAQRAWERLKPDAALQERMRKALALQIADEKAARATGVFYPAWPNPGTWIRDERWTDEVKTAPAGAAAAVGGPPSGEPYSPQTPIQCLVCVYKMLKGVEMEDRGWDTSNWAGAEPRAKHLLDAFAGDDRAAGVWLEAYGKEMDAGGRINWTLKSAAERAWNTKGARIADSPGIIKLERGPETVTGAALAREFEDHLAGGANS